MAAEQARVEAFLDEDDDLNGEEVDKLHGAAFDALWDVGDPVTSLGDIAIKARIVAE